MIQIKQIKQKTQKWTTYKIENEKTSRNKTQKCTSNEGLKIEIYSHYKKEQHILQT